jgi:hypothetical protein
MSRQKRTPSSLTKNPTHQDQIHYHQIIQDLSQLASIYKTAGMDIQVYFSTMVQYIVVAVIDGGCTKDLFMSQVSEIWDVTQAKLNNKHQSKVTK